MISGGKRHAFLLKDLFLERPIQFLLLEVSF